MQPTIPFLILGFCLVGFFGYLLFKLFDRLEEKMIGKYSKKTKLIIHGVLFLVILWGLRFAAGN